MSDFVNRDLDSDLITFTISAVVSELHLSKVHTIPVFAGMSHGSHTHSELDDRS